MPFTPFHFGPGAAIKAAAPRHFSLAVFCFSQVVIDVEVLVNMARGNERLHGWAHTLVGAAIVGIISVLFGRPICQACLRWWSREPGLPLKEFFDPDPKIGWMAAAAGAFVGSFSHLLLDSWMHNDLQPLWPFSGENHPFGVVGAGTIHLMCFVLGVSGAIFCGTVRRSKL